MVPEESLMIENIPHSHNLRFYCVNCTNGQILSGFNSVESALSALGDLFESLEITESVDLPNGKIALVTIRIDSNHVRISEYYQVY